ncbi:nucleoside-diphosphate kinase [Candidatus Dojkabacteria bacterium]|uniref:nucleoside-diphosphate kinase n=1 Tax=Candidatus Dojkabacteria bacterium TaxID=2099670 RepID=A0A955L8S5_9BACT|nr:nucleoside-diphosphate kinase [Candidatus Dojkabacteria bacterium]
MQRTLVIVKHDGVSRGLVGEIIQRIERVGYKLLAFEMIKATDEMGQKHYPNSNEWKQNVGDRTLREYKEKGIDPIKVLGTDDPVEIGELVKQWNVDYLTHGPVVAMVWEGPNAVKVVRKLVGDTIPANANPGTIRGDFSWDSPELANDQNRPFYNLIHASGTPDEAEDEIALWFDEMEVFDYEVNQTTVMGLHGKLQ